ncbi:MAG: hypothetical protein ACJ76M_09930 [Solirubrobacteraceae bacterium]
MRAVDGLGDVGNLSATPDADLVAKDPEPAGRATADGASGDDAPIGGAQVRDRCLLDHVRLLQELDLEGGVVEVAPRTPLDARRERLVDATIEPDEVAARAERQPVEIDGDWRASPRIRRPLCAFVRHAASIATGLRSIAGTPTRKRRLARMSEFGFAEEFLPAYDVSDAVAATVEADRQTAWRALLDVDLLKVGREAPLVGMLGALRMLPEIVGHLLHGERPAKPPESMRVRDLPSIPMYEGGWILLGERTGEEIALGLVGKFWRPTIEFASIGTAEEFRSFAEPGFAKTVYDLAVDELDPDTTLLSGLMRTATTDEHARRWFRRYWTFGVGSGAHILVGALLDSARRAAEGTPDG